MLGFLKTLRGNELDRLLRKAAKSGKKTFLVAWNRGLGDIALGLYALVWRIKEFIPDAQIAFLTRKELEDAFRLLKGSQVITVPWWERGMQLDMEDTLRRLHLRRDSYDIVLEKINPTKWLSWQRGKLTPKLQWKDEYDALFRRFNIYDPSLLYIGAHVSTETGQFYGYRKDWPVDNWRTLFERLSENRNVRIILFGIHKTEPFDLPSVIDLRGETGFLETLSIITNCCNVLIAPDGGILSIAYYLDVSFPITVISLWADPDQGVLKQAVPSPNPGLKHSPLIGKDGDISKISVDSVLRMISTKKVPV